MGKILQISLKLIFTPNTLGCYGLMLLTGDISVTVKDIVLREYLDIFAIV